MQIKQIHTIWRDILHTHLSLSVLARSVSTGYCLVFVLQRRRRRNNNEKKTKNQHKCKRVPATLLRTIIPHTYSFKRESARAVNYATYRLHTFLCTPYAHASKQLQQQQQLQQRVASRVPHTSSNRTLPPSPTTPPSSTPHHFYEPHHERAPPLLHIIRAPFFSLFLSVARPILRAASRTLWIYMYAVPLRKSSINNSARACLCHSCGRI